MICSFHHNAIFFHQLAAPVVDGVRMRAGARAAGAMRLDGRAHPQGGGLRQKTTRRRSLCHRM